MSRLPRHIELFESIERDSDLLSGSKLKMIQVLFEALCTSISTAQGHQANQAAELKVRAVTRAQKILKGLQLALTENNQSTLGGDLAELYAYMAARLWHANRHHDAHALEEVLSLARTLSDAWQTLPQPASMRFDYVGSGAQTPRTSLSYLV
ncbi:MAG: flagellar export chaperone FliS [Rhodoferax sp.]|jgi:flagellar protein FliS|nr:flagellar export chaperone FliS [Rhodoferax sp.]